MKVDRQETLRYLRMGMAMPDPALTTRLDEVEHAIVQIARPAFCSRLFEVVDSGEGNLAIGPISLYSRDLARTLEGCSRAFLFCATLGVGVDTIMRRYAQQSTVDQLLAQAVATALMETYCDDCMQLLKKEPEVIGHSLHPRFSPGYGDLSLAVQRKLLDCVNAERLVGVTLSEALVMIPSKSVSAIVGVE